MTIQEQQQAAAEFANRWNGRGYEKGEGQIFWCELLQEVFGVSRASDFITFESQVKLDHTSFIDGFIDATKVMIEQKSLGKNLKAGIVQSDGSLLSPFQQAKRYAAELPYSKRPRWIVTCNFAEFLVYDMEQPNGEPYHIALADLEKEYYRLQFLVDTGKEHLQRELEVSKKAGEIIGKIYDKLLERYINPTAPETLHSLNMLCVRLVFCLYAEDAGVFGSKQQFGDYIKRFEARDIRRALLDLFRVLDQKPAERDPYLDEELAAFPYVNGGLFSVEDTAIPQFTDELKNLLCRKASDDFDWSEISPTIFGAIFESTLNPETRRSGGMHYTSIENIHKVIDPLFLNDLNDEFSKIVETSRNPRNLEKLHDKIASLTFLDPACGSGNFLTETYISLRRLENKIISALNKGQAMLGFNKDLSPVKVGIHQFYGIEINDFAVTVARTALWIAEHQMLRETQAIVAHDLDFLPLKSYNNIIEGNALTIDWATLQGGAASLPRSQSNESSNTARQGCRTSLHIDYIMGNPPFVGARYMSKEQKDDLIQVFGAKWKNVGNLDFVCAWYKKAAEYMNAQALSRRDSILIENPAHPTSSFPIGDKSYTRCAFVSTNSICQGESVANLWKPLFEDYDVHIDFAYRTFRWDSESNSKAHVHCVIVGFSCRDAACCVSHAQAKDTMRCRDTMHCVSTNDETMRRGDAAGCVSTLYDESGNAKQVSHINGYLIEADDVFVESRTKPLCDVPPLLTGSQRIDNDLYVFDEDEMQEFIRREPQAAPYFRLWYGAVEFLHNKPRYCLYVGKCSPAELKRMPLVYDRVIKVREYRLGSNRVQTLKAADTPHRFGLEVIPQSTYIVVPVVSSERRRYVPLGFMQPDVLCSNQVNMIPNATLYHFGVLTSNVHNAWMRAVCGRLEMRYRYSKDIVYNNFPWPQGEAICNRLQAVENRFSLRAKIEKTAQGILDARALYPDSSLAELYDEGIMPIELRKAHRENDRAVMEAYGFTVGMTESECVARLMEMYQQLTK